MNEKYHKLWVLLREKLTFEENGTGEYSPKKDTLHEVLSTMSSLEAAEFLED